MRSSRQPVVQGTVLARDNSDAPCTVTAIDVECGAQAWARGASSPYRARRRPAPRCRLRQPLRVQPVSRVSKRGAATSDTPCHMVPRGQSERLKRIERWLKLWPAFVTTTPSDARGLATERFVAHGFSQRGLLTVTCQKMLPGRGAHKPHLRVLSVPGLSRGGKDTRKCDMRASYSGRCR